MPESDPHSAALKTLTGLSVDQAIVACGADMRATIRVLIVANEFLEHELRTKI